MVIVSCRVILSDHFAQFCVFKVPREKVISRTLGFWLQFREKKCGLYMDVYDTFSSENLLFDFSKSAFVHHLEHLNSDSVHGSDVNKSFFVFYNKLDRVINKHAPIKTISEHNVKQFNKAWISRAIRIAICKENELFYSGDKVKYTLQLYRDKILTLSQLS